MESDFEASGAGLKIPNEDGFRLMMEHKRSVAKVSLFIGIPLFFVMAIKNFIKGDNIMAVLNCMMLLILILLGFVIMRRIKEKSEYKIYSILFRLFFAVMGVSLFYDIGFQSNFSRIEWCYIYPVLVFLAVGVKEGAIWVSIFYIILASFILNFDLQGVTLFQIQELRSRFLVSFFAVCILSLFLEQGFRRVQQRLLHHHSILKESENRYRQAYEKLNIEMQERKQTEDALRESEERYRTILEDIEDGYFEVDIAGNFTFFNDSLCRMLGYPKDELMGMNNRQYMDKETGKKVYQVFNQVYTSGEPCNAFDWEIIRKDGIKRFHNSSVSLIRDSEGKRIGFRGIIRDITDYKLAEEALYREEEEARGLARENAIMAEMSRIISSSLEIDEVYERFAEEVRKLIPFDRIVINNIDAEKGTVINVYMAGKGVVDRKVNKIYPLEGSGNAEMVRAQSTLLIQTEDFDEYRDRFPMLLSTFQSGFRSIMNVPLFSKGRIIGGLLLRSYTPYAYTERDVRLAEKIGNQISGAIANAQLFTEQKQAEDALRRSEESSRRLAQETAVMAEIGRIISSTLDINEVYGPFAEKVREIIPFDRITIHTINFRDNTMQTAYITGLSVPSRLQGSIIPLAGTFAEMVLRTRKPMLTRLEDLKKVTDTFPNLLSNFEAGIRSLMGIPLISKNDVIGILHLQSTKLDAYAEKDLRLAERVGNQIAGAIANAQLFSERKRAEEERSALQEQLRQSQKMEAVGKLAGGVAHDFNNLLTVIHGYSELLLNSLDQNSRLRQDVLEIMNASERASSLTRQLLAFSRKQVLQPKVLDLNAHVSNMDKMLRRTIGEDIELVSLLAENLGRIKADPGQIEQVILNLVVNAKDAMPNGGKLTIETANVVLDESIAHSRIGVTPGRYVMLSMSDTGSGMTPEVKERIFEPFFTTKEKGKGTGLGLSTVYGIIQQSGGNIWVYSEPGVGTTFKIYLPTIEEGKESLRPASIPAKSTQGFETILLVEDEEMVRKLASTVLQKNGYTVLEASNGEEALRIVQEQNGNPIHLMVTDVVMPGMSGRQLADRLLPLRPEMRVLYMSGYTDDAIVHHGVLDPGIAYIQKPFAPDAFASKVRQILDGRSPST
jgi:PAS domain S-box-containing protein